ncbi:MAG TPA: hypothetical protein VJ850_10520 [Candidatus Limnocylindrales bacterium]|nr:hypothetical protein [Candidatus Limnocylindrales bacterium]
MTLPQRTRPRRTAPGAGAPAPRRTSPINERIGIALALVIVGALTGALLVGLAGSHAPAATATASTEPTDDPEALGSDIPEGSAPPVSAVLEALVPTTIDDAALTIQSAVDATSLSSGPDGRALNAVITHLGKDPSDLEIVYAYDESGSTDLVILGFRVDGIGVADIRTAILGAWLAANTPGVVQTNLDWSGTAVTKVSYGDEAADEFVFTVGDSVFVLETVDAQMAQGAENAIVEQAKAKASPGAATAEPASATSSPAATTP